MRKLSSGFHSLTASISTLSKAGGSANLSHLKASDVGILPNAGRSGSPSPLHDYLNDLRAISTVSTPGTVDSDGSVVNSRRFQKSFPLNNESYGASRCSTNGFRVRAGKDPRRSYYANTKRPSSHRQKAVEAAKAQNLHLHGCDREYSNFENLDLSGPTTARAERAATESAWKDTLLSAPGAISADVDTQRLFIADTNHHRVIIADGDGRIVDCIGSSPGMKDGTFETAQLCYPVSAIFEAEQNFLYIADSQNHIVRRADLSTRTLSTIKPPKMNSESTTWGRFLRWTGVSQPSEFEEESGKTETCNILRNPWHLKFTKEGLILVASRCFEHIWALDPSSAEITEFWFQDSQVLSEEFCRKAIDVKEMEDVYSLVLHEIGNNSTAENPWQIRSPTDIVSRVVRLHNNIFFIDTESQRIRKYDLDTGSYGSLHLSNLGLLGLPYWWSLHSTNFQSLYLLNKSGDLAQSIEGETVKLDNPIHIQPGRCFLCINPVLPRGMVLAAPIEDGSIWRQAKGSVVELSMFGGSLISHKVSSAQQWLDDLDDLDDTNPDTQKTLELTLPEKSENGIPFFALLDASLGTGEVTIDAVLHVRHACLQESRANSFNSTMGTAMQEGDRTGEDQIFLKHLHVQVRLEISTGAPEERTKHVYVQL